MGWILRCIEVPEPVICPRLGGMCHLVRVSVANIFHSWTGFLVFLRRVSWLQNHIWGRVDESFEIGCSFALNSCPWRKECARDSSHGHTCAVCWVTKNECRILKHFRLQDPARPRNRSQWLGVFQTSTTYLQLFLLRFSFIFFNLRNCFSP